MRRADAGPPTHTACVGRWDELAALARRQHLVVSVEQATQLGIPPRTVNEQHHERGWRRVHAGVYALAAAPDTFPLRASAALLSSGERSLLSGSTAAWCWGLRRRPPGRVEIITPEDRRVRAREFVDVRRSATLSHADVAVIDGLRVTSAPRTLVDVAARVSPAQLADLVVMAFRLGVVDDGKIQAQLNRMGPVRGKRALLRILADLPRDETDSAFERAVRAWLRRRGYQPDVVQVTLIDRGRVIGKVDVPFSRERVGIACDGRWTHLLPSAQRRDRAKDNAAAAMGWVLLHLLQDEFDAGGDAFLADLDRILRQRRQLVSRP